MWVFTTKLLRPKSSLSKNDRTVLKKSIPAPKKLYIFYRVDLKFLKQDVSSVNEHMLSAIEFRISAYVVYLSLKKIGHIISNLKKSQNCPPLLFFLMIN